MDIINMFSTQKAKEKLADCNVLLKYMAFLQNNGFSDYGKGQVMGQIGLLREYLEDGVEQKERDKEESKDSNNIFIDNKMMISSLTERDFCMTNIRTMYFFVELVVL